LKTVPAIKTHAVPMAQMLVVRGPHAVLETRSLGSCLGVTIYDPELRLGGLLHSMFPISALNPDCAREAPAMYTDTGIRAMLQEMEDIGACRDRLVVRMAGAAQLLGNGPTFQTGLRNRAVAREMFRRLGLALDAEDTGGHFARSLRFRLDTGEIQVRAGGIERALGGAVGVSGEALQ